jgi:hypothetical protein
VASHDLDFVRALRVDSVMSLEEGRLKERDGVPESPAFERDKGGLSGAQGLSLRNVAQRYDERLLLGERDYEAFRGLCVEFGMSTIYGITGPRAAARPA